MNTLIHSGIKQDYLVIYSTDLFKTTDSVSAFFCRLHNYRWPKGGDRGLFFWENLWSFYSTGYLQKDCHYVLVVGFFNDGFKPNCLNTQICSWMKQVSLLIIHLPDSFKNTDLFSDCFCRLHSLVTPVGVDKGQFYGWFSESFTESICSNTLIPLRTKQGTVMSEPFIKKIFRNSLLVV